ncbi:hypothetical protein FVEG_13631 [Fusarium verticillioides 7600]|uniref:Uncharacterized protein n=1 Tax=Gibberella moniliformis (strain M3125 / FGSC 7600) TaxID=334819 RepID=W7N6F0_GIBM7|nr:hypothetical protein FVEG_13631 [Fusarium verticillioides 7600]EWG55660.1 hypothetical protein FVEG_13631 [Fusarium verticillioides 7600]RBQ85222.1 hypothetical protein FVER53263_13631 [Fusarium verticillioides]RBR09847.1 hypothetical protein FVER53590_13631 [Fusarium verticillioides]
MTDNLKRKRSPTGLGGNFKHLKKTDSDKRSRSELIEINSDNSQSDNDSLSDAFSDLSSDDSEYSDNEAQMTDDERHLPRPQKRRTNRELQVTGSNNINVSTDELE